MLRWIPILLVLAVLGVATAQAATVAFTYEPAAPAPNEDVSFVDASLGFGNATRAWDFGDGATAVGPQATHAWSEEGTYVVTLSIQNRTAQQKVTVQAPPTPPLVASFSVDPDEPANGDTVEFVDDSTDRDGTITAWAWTLGDGSTDDGLRPQHTYEKPGTYTVSLTVADDAGRHATTSRFLVVHERRLGETNDTVEAVQFPGDSGFAATPLPGPAVPAIAFLAAAWLRRQRPMA